MIAFAEEKPVRKRLPRVDHRRFLELLPLIRRQARVAFRGCNAEQQEELISEVVANAFVAFARLAELGKEGLAFATPLAQYAIRQIRAGRRVGSRLNVRDLTSQYCRCRKGVTLERLDRFDREEMCWQEVLIESRGAGPAETAASRIDFAAWLRSLSCRQRRIATSLAAGETTSAVARRFRLTAGRISQFRRELQQAWEAFVADRPIECRCAV